MDIFISYRRGEGDSPNAGRIFDFLQSHGYSVFYDQDENSLPTGAQFPQTLLQEVESSRIILAVLGKSWIFQKERLHEPKDWVRAELQRANPLTERHFIPIYLGTRPTELYSACGLPEDLAFIATANSHCLWDKFEAAEKQALLKLLDDLLPTPSRPTGPGLTAKLELLCDRSQAESCFGRALRGNGKGWLLLGDEEQGQHRLFERVECFTLRHPSVKNRYAVTGAISLHLAEYFGRPIDEIRDHLFQRSADELREAEIAGWEGLRESFKRRQTGMILFWSVVQVKDAKQVDWWDKTFRQLLDALPTDTASSPRIFLALALSYRPVRAGLFSFLRGNVADDLKARYPYDLGYGANSPEVAAAPFAISWLFSAQRLDVENWCSNPLVRPYLDSNARATSLQPFDDTEEIPMARATHHLAQVLGQLANSRTPKS